MPTPSLLQRLKERKLVQWAFAHSAGAWVNGYPFGCRANVA